MTTISTSIRPIRHLHNGDGKLTNTPRTFFFNDDTTTIYPKLPSGQTCRVVIIRRKLVSSHGATFHACRNAGKWSFRVDYPMKGKTTRMPREKFVSELTRVGGEQHLDLLLES